MYIKPIEWMRLVGLGKTQYNFLKRTGALDGGIHPATKNSRRILLHRYYSYKLRAIVWFPKEQITLNQRGKIRKDKTTGSTAAQELSKHSQINRLKKAGGKNMDKKIHRNKVTEVLQQQKQELQSSTINSFTKAGGKNDEVV
jgi:hypothetical protein